MSEWYFSPSAPCTPIQMNLWTPGGETRPQDPRERGTDCGLVVPSCALDVSSRPIDLDLCLAPPCRVGSWEQSSASDCLRSGGCLSPGRWLKGCTSLRAQVDGTMRHSFWQWAMRLLLLRDCPLSGSKVWPSLQVRKYNSSLPPSNMEYVALLSEHIEGALPRHRPNQYSDP